jgi:hypothetical protein
MQHSERSILVYVFNKLFQRNFGLPCEILLPVFDLFTNPASFDVLSRFRVKLVPVLDSSFNSSSIMLTFLKNENNEGNVGIHRLCKTIDHTLPLLNSEIIQFLGRALKSELEKVNRMIKNEVDFELYSVVAGIPTF